MPELNFKIAGDDSDIKKTLANVERIARTSNAQTSKEIAKGVDDEVKARKKAIQTTQEQANTSKKVTESVNEETRAHDRATAAINRKKFALDAAGNISQIRPVEFTVTSEEVKAASTSKPAAAKSGAVATTSEEYTKASNEAKAFGAAAADASNKATDGANKTTDAIKNAVKAQDSLKLQLQSYQNIKGSATDPAIIAEYNKKIQETQAEIAKLNNVGKRGYDDLGNRIKSTIGLQEQLTRQLKYFQEQLNYAKAPQSFVTLNRKIEELQAALTRLSNAGKKGFDELGNKIKETDVPANKFLDTLKKIGASILAAFSIQMIVSWAKEARELAARGEGIREAFAKLDNGKTLELLRKATRGATTDIDLMAAALRAKNFQIAPELLAKGLELAGKVSRQTGQDVTYLTDSFVNGLGRKSVLILDNLQISQVQLRAEIKKTGDFQTAVGNVVNEKLASMGEVAMTTADKMAQFKTRIENIKEAVGQRINLVMNYDALREANKEFYETGLAVKNLENNIAPLLDKYDLLSAKAAKNGGITKLSKIEQTLLKDVIKQVGDEIPGAVTQFDKYGNAIAISTERAREFIAQQVLVLQALNEDRIKKTTDRLSDLKEELRGLKGPMDELAKTGNISITTRVSSENGIRSVSRKATKEEQQEIIKRYQDVSKTIAQQEALRAADSGELLKKRQKENDDFKKITKTDDGKAEEKAQKARERQERADAAALSVQENLQQRIQAMKDKFARNGLTKEQEARKAIIDEFKKLAFDIEQQAKKYDAYAKKYGQTRATTVLGSKQTTAQIEPVRQAAIDDLTYRQETYRMSLELAKQRALYEDFEIFKRQFGKEEADKRYKEELDTNTTFLKKVQDNYAAIILKNSLAQVSGKTLNGPERERYDQAVFLLNELKSKQNAEYNAAYTAAQSHEQRIAGIRLKYVDIAKQLGPQLTEAKKAELLKQQDDEIKSANITAFQKTAIYRKLAEEMITYTRDSLKAELKAAQNILKGASIPPEVAAEVQKRIDELNAKLDLGVGRSNKAALKERKEILLLALSDPLIKGTEEARKYKKELLEIQELIDNGNNGSSGSGSGKTKDMLDGPTSAVAASLSGAADQLGSAFNDLSFSLQGLNDDLAYTIGSIGELLNVASNAAGSVSSFASGDFVGGVSKAITAVSGLFSMGKKVKEMNAAARKEVDDFYKGAIAGEREYQDLLKQREIQNLKNQKSALAAVREELRIRKSQIDAYNQEANEIMSKLQGQSFIATESYTHGTWLRKAKVNKTYGSLQGMDFEQLSSLLAQGKLEGDAKTLVERLKELEQKGYDAGQAIADLAKQTSELFTGTTSDSLTNSLLEMFKGGKTGAEDLANFFKDTMDEAALSIFKNKVLADSMEKFYAEFDKAAQSGDGLTSDEIATLNGLFTSLTGDALKRFEEFKKITGSDLKGSDATKTGVSGAIVSEALTEGTANRVLGISQAQYDVQKGTALTAKDIVAVNTAQLNSLIKIEGYTGRTADNTDVLHSMAADMKLVVTNTKVVNGDSIDQLLRNGGVKA